MRLFVLLLLLTLFPNGAHPASPEATYGEQAMVTSRSVHASRAGAAVMRAGGNAVDGAVATAFALAVAYPNAGNLGGGGFAVIRLPDGDVVTLDHRETAPAAATSDMFLDENGDVIPGLSLESHMASGVPGTVAGLLALLERYGSLPREQILAPAIQLAKEGFPLDFDLARQFRSVLPRMAPYPASVAAFSRNGEPYEEGDIFRQPELAEVLVRIAREGRDGFYKGPVADAIVAEMERGGGLITHADLAAYQPRWREPVHGTYRGYDIWGMGPPSSGGVLLIQMLNMLETLDIAGMGYGSAAAVHALVEAARRAYADRSVHLGDPDFYQVPIGTLTAKDYAVRRFADFDPERATDSDTIGPGVVADESLDTTHLSVMDGDGMTVALTTTLNDVYGNKIVVLGAGFLLNNEMDDFSSKPGAANLYGLLGDVANAIAPGKRMLSSMSPTIVTRDDKPVLVTGSRGGSMIITTVLQVIVNLIDHSMSVEDAVSLPRIHHQWQPDSITAEPFALSPDTQRILEAMGHDRFFKTRIGRGIGDANSIEYVDGMIRGFKDPRREGAAIGF